MRNTARALAIAACLLPGIAAAQNLPPNTIEGRLGPLSGPVQAIPYATLVSQLQLFNNIVVGTGHQHRRTSRAFRRR